jgi:regulator of sigma E protease
MMVMLGGIIVNVILGVLIFSGVKYVWGEEDLTKDEANKLGIFAHPLAESIGLKTGDKIIAINGKDFETFSDVRAAVGSENMVYTVDRDGVTNEILIPNSLIDKIAQKVEFIEPILPFEVNEVSKGSAAEKVGLKAGDKIASINGKKISYYQELYPLIRKEANKKISLELIRDGKTIEISPVVSKDSTIGFRPKSLLNTIITKYTVGEAIGSGTKDAWAVIPQQINGFARIFKGHIKASNALSGPIELTEMFGSIWNWEHFWRLTGLLSMALAFMNALPIPAIDGGHVVILLYEMISGRKPSEKIQERIQMVGTFILLALMVYVIGNGILKKF